MKEAVKKSLLVQRACIEKRLDSARLYISNLNISSEAQFEALKVRQEQLPELYEAFNDIQAKFDAEGLEFDARDDFENKYYETLGSFRATLRQNQALFASHECQSQHCETLLGAQSPIQLKLPEIRLSQFSGDIQSWSSFRDTFKALVIDNRSISNINKFYYLINSLNGEAKLIVQNIPISAANFPVAWAQLESRYDDFRALVNTHVHALLNPPSLVHGSASSLQTYLDHFSSNVEALKALGSRVNVQDLLLSSLLSRSLDQHILQDWEMSVDRNSLPCFEDLTKFVQRRCKALAAATPGEPSSSLAAPPAVKHRKPLTTALPSRTRVCPCGKNHELYTCKEFIELPRTKRFTFVKENNLCFNCLRSRTANHQCSPLRCKMCDGSHHSLLHRESSPGPANTCAQGVNTRQQKDEPSCLLATAIVRVKDARDNDAACTALLDSGSDVNLITHMFAKSLGLPMKKTQSVIAGISSSESVSQSRIQATVSAKDGRWMKKLIFLVVPRITHDLPAASFECDSWNLPLHIDFADPCFNRSKPIDMLLAADTFFSVLLPGKLLRDGEHPLLQETSLGWVVSGQLPFGQYHVPAKATCGFTQAQLPVLKQLERFWELEKIPSKSSLSLEDRFCENHYVKTTVRDSSGRYIVRLPHLPDALPLGTSDRQALKRLESLEKRFLREPELAVAYRKFMQEYLDLGHMTPAPPSVKREGYYIPHLPVLKESSSSTKCRSVFDASALTSAGNSLNDTLATGPVLQQDLFSTVLRFRTHSIALVADISKMYRQILIHADDYPFQKIFWRFDTSEPVKTFYLRTVTYGTRPAQYLATRTLLQLAEDEGDSFPAAAQVLKNDFYIDDLITGHDSVSEAKELYETLTALLEKGGFSLRKWCSNSPEILSAIPKERQEPKTLHSFNNNLESNVKTLGLFWQPEQDYFRIACASKLNDYKSSFTKRSFLSCVASIFDPLGLIAPVVVSCKILFQKLWCLPSKLDWDDPLPEPILNQWLKLHSTIPSISDIKIPRLVKIRNAVEYEVHGFADASNLAYGGCIYLKSQDAEGQSTAVLLCAKSKVAPVKAPPIPRLELLGAVVLAKLAEKARNAIALSTIKTFLWTDSTVVLDWISPNSGKKDIFVANRVNLIHELTQSCIWGHVSSNENPADLISRGSLPENLIDNELWWKGPVWLKHPSDHWPSTKQVRIPRMSFAEAHVHLATDSAYLNKALFVKNSSYIKTVRILAYALRFANSCRNRLSVKTLAITADEFHEARNACVRVVQQVSFSQEINPLRCGNDISPKSHLCALSPFIHEDGLLRVGGRLEMSDLPFDAKHQIILPRDHQFTRAIVEFTHQRLHHAGAQLVIAEVRMTYWIVSLRQLVRNVIRSCLVCFRQRPQPASQIMGNLPADRVQPNLPFSRVGIDYTGYYFIKVGGPRSKARCKAYIAIFVCMCTKAVHLELVTSLSTQAFLSALSRFVSRRGTPSIIHSDNGTNFQGANTELRDLSKLLNSEVFIQAVQDTTAHLGITWQFIPPRAPWFGGLWEAAVKSAKYHLRRTMKSNCFTYEEFLTLITQIEAILNSRPLCPLSEDKNDFHYLSPGHFLIGRPLVALPQRSALIKSPKIHSNWNNWQSAMAFFWEKWSRNYLQALQRKTKWTTAVPNLRVGTPVLIIDDNIPPTLWKLGIIQQVFAGKDGKVRVANVRTVSGYFDRPIGKLCPLPLVDGPDPAACVSTDSAQ